MHIIFYRDSCVYFGSSIGLYLGYLVLLALQSLEIALGNCAGRPQLMRTLDKCRHCLWSVRHATVKSLQPSGTFAAWLKGGARNRDAPKFRCA